MTGLFITEQKVKDLTPISQNCVLTATLVQSIREAQESWIRPILCDDFYEELMDQVVNSTLTTENRDLLLQLQPCLAWYVFYQYLPFNFNKTRDAGTVNMSGDNYTSVDLKGLTFIRGEAQDAAERNAIVFRRWLDKNRDDYPTWIACQTNCGCEGNGITNNGTGLFFIV